MRHACLLLAGLLGTACSFIDDFGRFTFDESGDAGQQDGGTALDAGVRDAGAMDADVLDAGVLDAGSSDASGTDASTPTCDAESTFYRDDDGDGVGSEETVRACTRPTGYAEETGDCDDDHDDAYPGATELCDGRDQDCDTAIDEGVIGISAPIELIAAPNASAPLVAARHSGGYLVVAGAWARWVDLSGAPSSDAFQYDPFEPATQVDAVVTADSPPRLILAYGTREIYAKGYGIGATTTTLTRSLVVLPPTDPPYPLERMRLASAGDQIAVVATYYEDNAGQARASTLDPLAWTSGPTATLEATIRLHGLIPVASSPPHVLLSVSDEDGSGGVGTFRRLVVLPDVASWGASDVGEFGAFRFIDLPVARAVGPAEEVLGFLYDDNTASTCATAITPGEGTTAPTLGLCAPVTGSHRASAARGGVVSMISFDGFFTDVPLAPGTVGTPRFDMGIGTAPAALAVGADGGLVIYLNGGALYGRVLGCGG